MKGKTNAGSGGAGGIKIKKIWENTSPNSEFPAQFVALDLSKAQWVGVVQKLSTTTRGTRLQFCPVGRDMVLDVSYGATRAMGTRGAEISAEGIKFLKAMYNGSEDNKRIIPMEIYAIEGVSL